MSSPILMPWFKFRLTCCKMLSTLWPRIQIRKSRFQPAML